MTKTKHQIDTPGTSKRPVIEIPFYPLVMGAYLPLKLLGPNLATFDASEGIRTVVIMSLVGLALLTFFFLIIRRIHFAALLSGLVLGTILVMMSNPDYGLPFFLVTAAIIVLLWLKEIGYRATRVLNVFAIGILIQPAFAIAIDYSLIQKDPSNQKDYSPFSKNQLVVSAEDTAPNIVHIVLDGYADNDILKKEFNFDNEGFLSALGDRNFIVAKDAHAPYSQTLLVMASIFGGNYLTPGEYPLLEEDPDRLRTILGKAVTDGPLKRQLKNIGYSFISTESGYNFFAPVEGNILTGPTFASLSLNFFEGEFAGRLLEIFPSKLTSPLGLAHFQATRFNDYLRHALTTDIHLNQQSPFHYFIHLLAPHPPFVIDRYGETTDKWIDQFGTLADASSVTFMDPTKQAAYRDGYLDKLRYINSALIPEIDRLIAEVPSPKVIILHGDHGSGASFNHDDKSSGCLTDRYTPLLAIYSDNPAITKSFSRIENGNFNLVNIYRILSDASFGTSLGLLEDRSWYSSWGNPQNPTLLNKSEILANCPVQKTT
jgi:hypothetical protein